MTVTRNVGSEDSDLAVRDLARRTSVLPRHAAPRLALLEKAGLVDHHDRIVIRQMLDDIIAYDTDLLLPDRSMISDLEYSETQRLRSTAL